MRSKLILAVLALTVFACNQKAKPNVTLTTEMDSVSYAIGTSQAKGMLRQVTDLNIDAFVEGFYAEADSSGLKISEEDGRKIIQAFSVKLRKKQQDEKIKNLEIKHADDIAAGIKFLEDNKSTPGVKVTESGLQYIVLKEGKGAKPAGPTSKVKVHYTGTTPQGEVFDSSKGKDPIQFSLNGVIRGWTEGVQLMKEGAKYKFFIPQELAYGATPRPGIIKPFMPLVFEIELVEVLDKDKK